MQRRKNWKKGRMPYIVSDLLIRCNAERIESCSYHWGAVPRHALCRCNAERIERIDLQEDVRKGAGEPLRCNSERIESQPPQKKTGLAIFGPMQLRKNWKFVFHSKGSLHERREMQLRKNWKAIAYLPPNLNTVCAIMRLSKNWNSGNISLIRIMAPHLLQMQLRKNWKLLAGSRWHWCV